MRKVKGFVLGLGKDEYEFSAKEARNIAEHFGLDRLERKVKHNRIGLICLAGFGYLIANFIYVDPNGVMYYEPEHTLDDWRKKLGLVKKEDAEDEN